MRSERLNPVLVVVVVEPVEPACLIDIKDEASEVESVWLFDGSLSFQNRDKN